MLNIAACFKCFSPIQVMLECYCSNSVSMILFFCRLNKRVRQKTVQPSQSTEAILEKVEPITNHKKSLLSESEKRLTF